MNPPLAGVRVLDLTRLMPGNYCAWLLAALGADVVKVEDPGAGDYMRDFGVQVDGQGAAHHVVNRAKRSVVIDLKHADGRDAFLRLVDNADVVIESFRTGVMERLGVGYETLRERRLALIMVSISGYGALGPARGAVAHDVNALAFTGLLERLGGPGRLPEPLPVPFADLIGGGIAPALGVLALLRRAEQTGEGGRLDASLADGIALLPSVLVGDLLAGAELPAPGGGEFDGAPFYRVYALRDGEVAVGAVEPQFWVKLCELLGMPELGPLQHDRERQAEVVARVTERFSQFTRAECRALLEGHDTCTNVVQAYPEMLDSEHASARDLVRPATDAPTRVLTAPFLVDGERPPETRGAPRQGQHSREVLSDNGFSAEEIERLVESGAVDGHLRRAEAVA